jgi:hypothetical protein
VAGVWVAGGQLSNDFRTSVALTTAWFVLSGMACLALAVRVRPLRLPVLGTYVAVAGAVGGYLGYSTLHDRVAHERVVTAAPPTAGRPPRVRGNVVVAGGRFRSGEHTTVGHASVVRLPDGRRFLTLTRFRTSPGPDLRVRLVAGNNADGAAAGAIDLGGLKGNRGDQQYRVPRGAAVRPQTVVVWCRAFSVAFGTARLSRPR